MANPICYGDIVYIDFNDLLLSTNGFYDPTLYLVSTENITLKSFRNGLFKLYPNLSYKDTSQVEELRHQLDLLKSLHAEEKFAAEQLEKDMEIEQKTLEAREARLEELNEKMFNEAKGQAIKYGQKIQLLHIESQTFVSLSKKLNKEDKTLVNLELTNKGSKSLYFKLDPKLSLNQEGEVVEYNTPIQFVSCKSEAFLTKAELNMAGVRTELNPETNKITNDEDNFPKVAPRRKEPIFESAKVYYAGVKTIDVPENICVRKFLSFQDEEKSKLKKTLKNGDYIRITDEKFYLTGIQQRTSGNFFFQRFNGQLEYRYSKILTLFQIIEVNDKNLFEDSSVEKDKTKVSKFPQGHLLEYDEAKRYLLKHVISGKYVTTNDNGVVTLVNYDNADQDVNRVSIVINNKSKNELGENYIDRNCVMQFKFYTTKDKTEKEVGTFTFGQPIKIPNVQLETNTWFYYGFLRPENYLNKWLRTERHQVQVNKTFDIQNSSFRLLVPGSVEIASIFQVESLANSIQEFLDYLDDFIQGKNRSVKDFNDETKKLAEICTSFLTQIYEEEYNEAAEDILTPDTTKQTLLREFRVYDLMYRVFLHFAHDESLANILEEIKKQTQVPVEGQTVEQTPLQQTEEEKKAEVQTQVPVEGQTVEQTPLQQTEEKKVEVAKVELVKVPSQPKDIDLKTEINFPVATKLLKALQKIILISFKKNDLNHYYCSQFIRVPINCVVASELGLYKLVTEREKIIEVKELMLALCQEGLWDKDLDALGQLNFYEAVLFEAIEMQRSYHTVFLKLMRHISSSKAPNLQNLIRDNFVYNFLSKSINMSHVFPQLVEEDGNFCIQFKRKKDKEQNKLLNFAELVSTTKEANAQEKQSNEDLINYFLESLQLIFALITVDSSMLELKFIRYLTFDNLTKAINILGNVPQYRELKGALREIISKVHQNYFAMPFTKLPKQVQILDRSVSLKSANLNINTMINDSITTTMSTAELEYIKDEDIFTMIESLKTQITSENQVTEILKMLEISPSLDQIEYARNLLEDIKKVLESNSELDFIFLKKARQVLNYLLENALKKQGKAYWEFIKQCLDVYNVMENKTLAYAATDIVRVLKERNLFIHHRPSVESPTKSPLIGDSSVSPLTPESEHRELLKPGVKVNPEILEQKELSTRNTVNPSILPTVVENYMRQWKTGERFLIDATGDISQMMKDRNKLNRIGDAYKEANVIQNLNILLEIFLLNQDHLLSDVIHRLKKVSSFESLLYRELNRLTILHDDESLNKTTEVIRITFRLNEISRDVFFCKDNLIQIEDDRLNELLKEVLEHQWNLFFMLYEPARHFRYLDANTDPKKLFREIFEKAKKERWDICFKLKPGAINKPYQKVFNILTTYKSLIKTKHWVLDKKVGFDEKFITHNYIIRLNVLILTAFVMGNKENQVLFSESRGIIRQFYNQHFINQTPDSMMIYAEMMRDNKKLLKLPIKYLYDITMSTFVGTMARSASNEETNGYLCAGIQSMHFLSKAMIPIELYSPINDMKTKWHQVAEVHKYTKLKVTNTEEDYSSPFCYYTIRSIIEETMDMVDHFCSEKNFGDIQLFLGFPSWLSFFLSENYTLQFELKNWLAKCMIKIYFEHDSKQKLLQESEECLSMIATIAAEIAHFRENKIKKTNEDASLLHKIIGKPNFITNHENFIKVKGLYADLKDINLQTKHLEIYGEHITLENLLYEYMYEGCLDLLFHIVLKEVDFCKEVRGPHQELTSIMDFVLALLDEFTLGEQNDLRFPHRKIEDFLTKASVISSYTKYKDKILKLANRVYLHHKTQKKAIGQRPHSKEAVNPLEVYEKHINSLQVSRKLYKEQNIKQVADCIAEHPQNKVIIKQIMKYLKKDPTKLDPEEIIFILKLLRKYIERENTNNPEEEPIYLWKEINIGDLKKIDKIQQTYRYYGLSNLLFIFFGSNDSKILREAILLSLAYMYGGNSDVQHDFYTSFRDDDDNRVIVQLRNTLTNSWDFFRTRETKRLKYLYSSVQKTMFEYFKGKKIESDIDEGELQIKIFEAKIDPQYVEFAENNKENQLFIQTLTFLQGLCEGQFSSMQNFLREQRKDDRIHPKSFDFLNFLRHSTNTYYKVLSKYNLLTGNKILDLIIELIQGEVHENVAVFLYKTFIYDMCRVLTDFNTRYHTLPRGFGLNLFHEDFREFKGKVIFLFKTMLENKNETNRQILTSHLDTAGLMNVFESLLKEFVRNNVSNKTVKDVKQFVFSLTNENFRSTLGDAINIYIIFRYIWEDADEFNDKVRELIKGMDASQQDFLDKIIFNIFPHLVSSIEMVDDSKANSLRRVWFPVIAVCHYLNPETKKNFLKYVDRSNSQTKISALIDSSQEFVPQMYAEYNARNWVLGFNMNNIYYGLRFVANFIAVAVTFLNIGTFKLYEDSPTQEQKYENAAIGLNIAQIAIASTLIVLWWSLLRKRHLSLMWERYVDQNIKSSGFLPPTIKNKLDEGDHKDLTANECRQVMLLKGANSDEFKEMRRVCNNFKQISFDYHLLKASFVVKSPALLWHLVYLGITIGSLFHPLVAVFQIFDIAIRSDTIVQIYASISRNAKQFCWTLFLLVLVNIVYSSIGFFFLNDSFVDKDNDDQPYCDTAFACFLNVLNLGLRSGGGVGDVIRPQPYYPDAVGMFVGRVIFDLSFFILMITLLLNLIFGMIIDAFGDLRDEKTRNEADQKNVCFICGIERSQFERHTNFDEHSLEEHNIWAYVYYIVYLHEKEKTFRNNLTDIERLVLEKYKVKDYSWIPIGKSLTLEKIYALEKFNQEDDLGVLTDAVTAINDNIEEMKKQMKDLLYGRFGQSIVGIIDSKMDQIMNKIAK